ncbi:MAG: hypothetical protein RSD45_08450, partial [Gordonibacter sp.]
MYGGNPVLYGGYLLTAGWSTQEELTGYKGDTGEALADRMLCWSQGMGGQVQPARRPARRADLQQL